MFSVEIERIYDGGPLNYRWWLVENGRRVGAPYNYTSTKWGAKLGAKRAKRALLQERQFGPEREVKPLCTT